MTLLQERDVEIRRLTQFNHELNDKIEDRQNEIKQMKYRLENIERENENHSSDLIRIKQKKNKIEQEKSSLERQAFIFIIILYFLHFFILKIIL